MRITLAQVNPTVGDLDYNLDLISRIWNDHDAESDLIVFPELVTTGYPPEDLLHNRQFIKDTEQRIAQLVELSKAKKSAILIGTPQSVNGQLYNSALLIGGGKIIGQTSKHHLPNYGVFDEKRYFTSAKDFTPIDFMGQKLGVLVCEDMWFPDVAAKLREGGAEILISLHGSPFEIGKHDRRLYQANARVGETGLPLLYVNQIGGQDDVIYDGSSFVMDKNGNVTCQAKSFEEGFISTNCHSERSEESPLIEEQLFRAATLGLKDYMRKTRQKQVLIGLSGGVDSALTAAIAVEALGANNVHAIMMPSHFTSQESLDDAAECAKRLGIAYEIIPIANMIDTFVKDQPETSGLAHENLQSRLRGLTLMTRSNMTGAMVVTTGNKSEMATGYATLYGDMCGGYNPLKDMYKTKVYSVCHWYNATHGDKIPHNIISKKPTAELRPNQTDQDSLPPYDILDAILERLIERDMPPADIVAEGFDTATIEKVAKLLKIAEYKRHQSAPGPKLTTRAFARERRYPIANGY